MAAAAARIVRAAVVGPPSSSARSRSFRLVLAISKLGSDFSGSTVRV
jgi:hypothetical protein